MLFGEVADIMKYMRTIVEITNLTKKRISSDFVKKVVRKTAKLAGADLDCLEISIVFVGEAEIRKINQKYRQKNKSTDVFSLRLDLEYNKKRIIQGEIILCPDIISKNARENKVNFSRELIFVLAHGILHVLGWKHGRKMYSLQDKICE
ncbi:MAG: rRNA maturation RNase YbeY [Candidatus Moranbacteria bacterium RBG_13_45_13]|nr:MAG: rRNA maturation RNase YbeY [Candidatus Moranbacteria bacterium RBG_13_45_13]